MKLKLLSALNTEDDLDNLILGGAFLGSGGGGPISAGNEIKEDILKSGKTIQLIQPEDLQKESELYGAIIAFMGSPKAGSAGIDLSTPTNAFNALAKVSPTQKMDFILPIELGAGNSLVPFSVSVRKNLPVVDCDGAGRAVPKIQCTTYDLNVSASPASLANGDSGDNPNVQNIIYLEPPAGASLADEVEKYALELLETPSFGSLGGLGTYQMKGSEVLNASIPHSLSFSFMIGDAIRQALAGGADVVKVVTELLQYLGKASFTYNATVKSITPYQSKGLDLGEVTLEGTDGTLLYITYENENLFARTDQGVWGMAPDLLCYLTPEGPVSNVEIQVGMQVTLVGIPADDKMRSTVMIQRFEDVLKEMGIDQPYIPIEKIHTTQSK